MYVGIGRYENLSVELLILKQPSYVIWILNNQALVAPLTGVKQEILRLLKIFNEKPFIKKCSNNNCGKQAVRFAVQSGTITTYWLCESCNPFKDNRFESFKIISTYEETLKHFNCSAYNNKSWCREIIIRIAHAKGLPNRVGEKQADAFFSV